MPGLSVRTEADKVMMSLHGYHRDILLSSLTAANLAEVLDEQALVAEKGPNSLIKGEVWDVFVTNFDHKVVMRITPPIQCHNTRVMPMPSAAARAIAQLLRTNAEMASYGLQVKLQRN